MNAADTESLIDETLAKNEGHGFRKKANRDYMSATTSLFLRRELLGESLYDAADDARREPIGEQTMRAAKAVATLAVACCLAVPGEVREEGAVATESKVQTSASDALAASNCESYEGIMDRVRLGAAEYSESGVPLPMKVWKQVVKFRKAQIDEEAWAWFQKSVDAPSTVPALREAHPDFPTGTLELVKNALAMDAETITTAGPGSATADDLVLSVYRQLIRQEFAEGVTFSRIHLMAEHATRPHGLRDPATWTTFAATFTPHEDVYNGYGTSDLLQAIYAASDNKLVIETHHLDGYNLLKMVGYQVAQRLMLDAMIDVAMTCGAVETCGESGDCETVAEAGAQTCGTAADFCRASQQAARLGICDAFPQRCQYAVDCVRRTAQGAGTDGNCIVDSWEALRSSEFLPEGIASSEGEAMPTP